MKMLSTIILSLLLFTSCGKEGTPTTNAGDPSDLNLEILTYQDNSGIVVLNASATNAVEYRFLMGDGSDTISNINGNLEYTYTNSGLYTLDVRAYGSSGRFVSVQKKVNVKAEEPINIGVGYSTPVNYSGMELIWSDEFNGTELNSNDWSYDIGDGCPDLCGWGNNELEYYRAENVSVENGVVILEARDEAFGIRNWTSGKIVTRGKQAFQFGRIDIRAQLPKGQGIWPALWLLGTNQVSVGWPKCGEIDIMEMKGGNGREKTITGNVFWDLNGVIDQPSTFSLNSGLFSDEFHVFSLVWDESKIKWLVDDQEFKSFDITSSTREAFQKPFYMIFNVAVGGNFPGSPDETTIFPTEMRVDYVRVFRDL